MRAHLHVEVEIANNAPGAVVHPTPLKSKVSIVKLGHYSAAVRSCRLFVFFLCKYARQDRYFKTSCPSSFRPYADTFRRSAHVFCPDCSAAALDADAGKIRVCRKRNAVDGRYAYTL